MNITLVKEHEDGSADYNITNMSAEEQQYLIQKGLIAMLKEFVEREQKEGKLPALLKASDE
jgi:hypothetical protein